MQVDYPLQIDAKGRLATTSQNDHIRDLIEQVLFTALGERVNRPTFGSGVLQLIFEPGGEALASSTQSLIQGALQEWLGELIQVEAVAVSTEDATLQIAVQYIVRSTRERVRAQFARGVP